MPFSFRMLPISHCFVTIFNKKQCSSALIAFHTYSRVTTVNRAISRQRPTTNIKPDMVCVKLLEITE